MSQTAPAVEAAAATAPRLPVTFFIADRPDFEELRRLDPETRPRAFRQGECAWVVQTYLRLHAAGYPVTLTNGAPGAGLVVFHAKHKHVLAPLCSGRRDVIFVGIRADNSEPLLADFEVVQNGWYADGRRRFPVPLWPQPGIRPRDPTRGTRVERIGYMGRTEHLAPEFRDGAWTAALAGMGIEWVPNMIDVRPSGNPKIVDWEDYRDLDAVLAVRPDVRVLRHAKPANKLVNAWMAAVPAVVGPEFAFRELRRSNDDFLEADDPASALAAVRRLREDPELYRRMVANGLRRALEFSYDEITTRWADLLFEVIPNRCEDPGLNWTHRLPLALRLPTRRLLRIAARRPSR